MSLYDQLAALPVKERDTLMGLLGYTKKRALRSIKSSGLVERKPPRLTDKNRALVSQEWTAGVERWKQMPSEERQDRLFKARIEARGRLGWWY